MMDQADSLRNLIRAQQETPNTTISTNARVITVTSGKGGVGKTSLSLNLALQMQRLGKKTVIIDADFGLANIEVMLGIHPKYNMSDLIYKDMNIEDVVENGPEGIGFISGGSGVNELVNLDKSDLQIFVSKVARLDKIADVIIVDTGAGISDAVQEFVLCSPEVLVVLTPEPTSTMDAYALLKALNRRKEFVADDKSIHVVSNRVENEKEGQTLFSNISIVASQFLNIKLDYLGSIPQDMSATKAVLKQQPVSLSFPNSTAAKSMRRIAEQLLDVSDNDKTSGFVGMFMNLIRSNKNKD